MTGTGEQLIERVRSVLAASGGRAGRDVDRPDGCRGKPGLFVFIARQQAYDHYEQYPQARPDLADLAIATAELDGHPLAAEPERLRQAAAEIVGTHPDASPDDVLLWAEARALPAA